MCFGLTRLKFCITGNRKGFYQSSSTLIGEGKVSLSTLAEYVTICIHGTKSFICFHCPENIARQGSTPMSLFITAYQLWGWYV